MLNDIIKSTQHEITNTLPTYERAQQLLQGMMEATIGIKHIPDAVWVLKVKLEELIAFHANSGRGSTIKFIPDESISSAPTHHQVFSKSTTILDRWIEANRNTK